VGHPGYKWNKQTIEITGKNADPPASVTDDQPAGKRHSQECPHRGGKKDQAHHAIVDAELILNSRQPRKIVGVNKAIKEENNFNSDTGRRHAILVDSATKVKNWINF
jgi:hypothetical protein